MSSRLSAWPRRLSVVFGGGGLLVVAAEDELLRLLDDAAAVVSSYGAMNLYCRFDTGAAFAAELRSLRERVARQDWSALGPVVGIFAPTGAWGDGVGAPGMYLANRVMAVLDEMDWSRRARPYT